MYTKDYIQATYEVIRKNGDIDAVLISLKSYLKKHGLSAQYPNILGGLLERMEHRGVRDTVRVTLARESDFKKHKEEITNLIQELTGTTEHTVHIDPHIIGGFSVETGSKQIDKSYKGTLLHAYQRITTETL